MQQVIYADVLIFFNTVITFIILLTTSQILNIKAKAVRLVISSLVGGLYSLMILSPEMNAFLVLAAKLAMSISLVFIAFDPKKFKQFIKLYSLFIICNFLFSGIMYFIYFTAEPEFLKVNNGFAYYNISVTSMLIISVSVYAVIFFLRKVIFKKTVADDIYKTDLCYGGKKIETKALLDTGNNFYDVFTGKPVVIINTEASFVLTGEIITKERLADNVNTNVRLLPIRSVNGENLLPAFTADKAIVYRNDTAIETKNPSIAVTEDALGGEKYSALISRDFI